MKRIQYTSVVVSSETICAKVISFETFFVSENLAKVTVIYLS